MCYIAISFELKHFLLKGKRKIIRLRKVLKLSKFRKFRNLPDS